jgi:hypothetical protein
MAASDLLGSATEASSAAPPVNKFLRAGDSPEEADEPCLPDVLATGNTLQYECDRAT